MPCIVLHPPILSDGSIIILSSIFYAGAFMPESRTKARFSQPTADDTQRLGIAAALVLAVVTALGLHTLVSAPTMREAARRSSHVSLPMRIGMSAGNSGCGRRRAHLRLAAASSRMSDESSPTATRRQRQAFRSEP